MYLSNIENYQEHKYAENILIAIARLMQLQDDFFDCWGDPVISGKVGTDIQQGKCSWFIITAYKLANELQGVILKNNYGKNDMNSVNKIKRVYEELKLKEIYYQEETNQYVGIIKLIQDMKEKSKLNSKIFSNLLDKVYIKDKNFKSSNKCLKSREI